MVKSAMHFGGGGGRGGEEGNGIDNRKEKVRQQGWRGGGHGSRAGTAGQSRYVLFGSDLSSGRLSKMKASAAGVLIRRR